MKKTTIYYFYDALCGWCFGFSPIMQKTHEKYQKDFNFEIISGGLKLGSAVGPIGEVAPYIKAGAYKQVEQMCNVKFGEDFVCGPLEEGTIVLDSLTPAIALSIVKEQKPSAAFRFGGLLHHALYVDGDDIGNVDMYGKYAKKIGLDADGFITNMQNPIYEDLAKEDFELTKRLGATGFPAIVAEQDGQSKVISRGFIDYENLVARLDQLK